MRKSKRRDRYINLLVIVLSVVFRPGMAGAAGYYILTCSREARARTTSEPLAAEENVKAGTFNDPEKRQQGLNSVVEEGMVIFSINATPFMMDGKGKASLMVENPSNSGKRFIATIQRGDTGEVIYRLGYLDPEQYTDEVPLDVELAKGRYACIAYSDACCPSGSDCIERAGARITLYVLE